MHDRNPSSISLYLSKLFIPCFPPVCGSQGSLPCQVFRVTKMEGQPLSSSRISFQKYQGHRMCFWHGMAFPIQNGVATQLIPSFSSVPGLPVRGEHADSHQQAAAEPRSYRCPPGNWLPVCIHSVFPTEVMRSLLASLCLGFSPAEWAQQTYLVCLF